MSYFRNIDFKFFVIIVLVLVILFMKMCGGEKIKNTNDVVTIGGNDYEVIKHVRDTIYEPVIDTIYKKGETIYLDTIIYVGVLTKVDTLLILKDFLSKRVYKDTLKLEDSLGYVSLIDTISTNKIIGRRFISNVNKIKIHDTIFLQEPKKIEVFGGGTIGMDKSSFVNFLGPTLNLKTKNDNIYGLSLGLNNRKSVTIQGTILWKIKFKK